MKIKMLIAAKKYDGISFDLSSVCQLSDLDSDQCDSVMNAIAQSFEVLAADGLEYLFVKKFGEYVEVFNFEGSIEFHFTPISDLNLPDLHIDLKIDCGDLNEEVEVNQLFTRMLPFKDAIKQALI